MLSLGKNLMYDPQVVNNYVILLFVIHSTRIHIKVLAFFKFLLVTIEFFYVNSRNLAQRINLILHCSN